MTYPTIIPDGYKIVPIKPTTIQMRALLKHRGYDPDADESTLDKLGQLDIATMSVFLKAYEVMVEAYDYDYEVMVEAYDYDYYL